MPTGVYPRVKVFGVMVKGEHPKCGVCGKTLSHVISHYKSSIPRCRPCYYKQTGRLPWGKDELEYLLKNYKYIGMSELISHLKRSEGAIRLKARYLGVYADRTMHWTDSWKFINDNPYSLLLSKEELAYIAGIFDGEGCLSLLAGRKFWRMSVGNTNKDVIDWLHNKIPYTFVQFHKKRVEKWKDQWAWVLHGNIKIKALLELLLPYLIVKKAKAEEVIQIVQKELSDVGIQRTSHKCDALPFTTG